MDNWFDISKDGLGKLTGGRGKAFVLYELIQNAWDKASTRVEVVVEAVPKTPKVSLVVRDDSPTGFADLSRAYTLFAESTKKRNPEQRGRFNLGEKLVLSLCERATITTTTGSVAFTPEGRKEWPRRKTEQGSVFEGILPMTRSELAELLAAFQRLIPPHGISTTLNGDVFPPRTPITTFQAKLATVIADETGISSRKTERVTQVEVHEVRDGETATLYEMGIPVVETGDRFHVNVMQKVSFNSDRDNVTPAYLRSVRVHVLSATFALMKEDEAADGMGTGRQGAPRREQGCPFPHAGPAVRYKARERLSDTRVHPTRPRRRIPSRRSPVVVEEGVGQNEASPPRPWCERRSGILPCGRPAPSPRAHGRIRRGSPSGHCAKIRCVKLRSAILHNTPLRSSRPESPHLLTLRSTLSLGIFTARPSFTIW